jgi:tRNA pseudouridine38-40 synthase
MSVRMKLIIAYHGRLFHGWQRQKGQRTIQGELEGALGSIAGFGSIPVTGAGRTDAGVHATGQTAHCDVPIAIPPEALVRALNRSLPPEIRVRSARTASSGFHARKSARGKLYTYRARWRATTLPWADPLSAQVTQVSDLDQFENAVRILVGRHDWASFTVVNPERESTVRTISRVSCRHRRSGVDIDFLGDGFLRYQVRRMVGAALEVGQGRRRLGDFRALIEHLQPGAPIQTAPAAGLTLHRVFYRKTAELDTKPAPVSPTPRGPR